MRRVVASVHAGRLGVGLAVALLGAGARAQPADTVSYVGTGASMTVTSPNLSVDALLVMVRCGRGTPSGATVFLNCGANRDLGPGWSKSAAGPWLSGAINTLVPAGFTLGTAPEVNTAGVTCDAFIATNDMFSAGGSYTGDGAASQTLSLPDGDYVLILPGDNAPVGHYLASRGVATEVGTGNVLGGVTFAGGRMVVSGPFNRSGIAYHVTEFYQRNPNQIAVGYFLGDGTDNRDISIGGQPCFVMTDTPAPGVTSWRPAALPGDQTLTVTNTGAFANGIQQLTIDGFQVGTDSRVTNPGAPTFYVAVIAGYGSFDAGRCSGSTLEHPTAAA